MSFFRQTKFSRWVGERRFYNIFSFVLLIFRIYIVFKGCHIVSHQEVSVLDHLLAVRSITAAGTSYICCMKENHKYLSKIILSCSFQIEPHVFFICNFISSCLLYRVSHRHCLKLSFIFLLCIDVLQPYVKTVITGAWKVAAHLTGRNNCVYTTVFTRIVELATLRINFVSVITIDVSLQILMNDICG